jgi:hypothetical protein
MAGTAITIAVERTGGGKAEPLSVVAEHIAAVLRGELETVLRRERDVILAAFREECERWGEGPEQTVNLTFSGECPAIVRHVAFLALLRCRPAIEERVLPVDGYRLVRDSPWSPVWVEPLRAACWGSTRTAGKRDVGGPFVPAGGSDDDTALGWREVVVAGADDSDSEEDAAERYAALSGLCGCDMCVSSQHSAVLGDPPRRSGRESAVLRMRERLEEVTEPSPAAVLADLEAWSWTGKPPASFEALRQHLGRPANALELVAVLQLIG